MGTSAPQYAEFKTHFQGLQSQSRVKVSVAESVARAKHLSLDDDNAIPLLLARVAQHKGIQLTEEEKAIAARQIRLHLQTLPT